ncbi:MULTISPECIES: hypothetical protein [unclassified Roseovarius]|uniref:hypothetical protein n=1 Tax=unclassified Roseovarius TaxID=2614913 RepID=UPI00273EDD29|nr:MULTISPECIES: hypothetical protein [unclassified Roseovarius]
MSKPVTNVEIEDVLSSIRRLVSTSDQAERGEGEAQEDVAEKLVLTPALRVDEPADDVAESAENAVEDQDITELLADDDGAAEPVEDAPEDVTATETEAASDEAFFEKIADAAAPDEELEATDDAKVAEEETDVTAEDTDSLDTLDAILSETTENSNEIDEASLTVQDAADDGENPPDFRVLEDHERADSAGETADDEAANNLQRRAAEFEAIIATTEDAWDPDGTTEDDNAASPVGPLPWQEDADEADEAAVSEDDADDVEGDPADMIVEETAAAADPAEDLEVPEAEDEAAQTDSDQGETDDEATAEVSAEDDDADLARVMADLARVPPVTETQTAVEDADQSGVDDLQEMMSDTDPAPFVFRSQSGARQADDENRAREHAADEAAETLATEEAMLDEESLRDMVSEIVRQELQGALGERITRNVRKLVRREIHRALASQELE